MKVIDLLNKIANGEEVPEKIIFNSRIYELTERDDDLYNYKNNFSNNYFEEDWFLTNILNDEVEIIEDTPKEDKKIKRIEERESGWWPNSADGNVSTLKQAINEIIDRLNGEDND
jgi:hypothetical protein